MGFGKMERELSGLAQKAKLKSIILTLITRNTIKIKKAQNFYQLTAAF